MPQKPGLHRRSVDTPSLQPPRSTTSSSKVSPSPQTDFPRKQLPYTTERTPLDLDQSAEAFSSFAYQVEKSPNHTQQYGSGQISNMGDPRNPDGVLKTGTSQELETSFNERLVRQMDKSIRYSLPTASGFSSDTTATRPDDSLMLLVNAISQQEKGRVAQPQFPLPPQTHYATRSTTTVHPSPLTPILPPYNPSVAPSSSGTSQHLPSISQLPLFNSSHQLGASTEHRNRDASSGLFRSNYASNSLLHPVTPYFASGQAHGHYISQAYNNASTSTIDIAQQAQLHLQMYLLLQQQWQQQQLAKLSSSHPHNAEKPSSKLPETHLNSMDHERSTHSPGKQQPASGSVSSDSNSNSPSTKPGYLPELGDATAEDKRRRNTAASARFRKKKKERTISVANRIENLEVRMLDLAREAEGLRQENGWLKEMVILKGKLNVQRIRGQPMTEAGTSSETSGASQNTLQSRQEKAHNGPQERKNTREEH